MGAEKDGCQNINRLLSLIFPVTSTLDLRWPSCPRYCHLSLNRTSSGRMVSRFGHWEPGNRDLENRHYCLERLQCSGPDTFAETISFLTTNIALASEELTSVSTFITRSIILGSHGSYPGGFVLSYHHAVWLGFILMTFFSFSRLPEKGDLHTV